jgi:hypothetical protein
MRLSVAVLAVFAFVQGTSAASRIAASGVAASRTQAGGLGEGLLTTVEYSGSWSHDYTGPPSGIAGNSGTFTIHASLRFVESVSLFTPAAEVAGSGDGASSTNSPVGLKLSGAETVSFSPDPQHLGCSVTFSAISGLSGPAWGAALPLAWISVNQSGTKGRVAVWAEAPGLRSSDHPELSVTHTGGNADSTYCQSGNAPLQPPGRSGAQGCNPPISEMSDPQWTAGDRGLDQPPYGFLHAVAILDPHTPTYSHHYTVDDTRQTPGCGGTDSVIASSDLIVNNSSANGPPAPVRAPQLTPTEKWKAAARKVKLAALNDLRWSIGFGANTCGLLASGIALTAFGLVTGDPVAAGSGAIMTTLGAPTDPICKSVANRIGNDLDTIHDPPLAAIHELARVVVARAGVLPSCSRWHGQARVVCDQLRDAATRLVAQSQQLTGVDDAIATTIGRGSEAVARHDNSAITLQLGRLTTLAAQQATALAAEQADVVQVAQVLATARVDANITRAQLARGVAHWLATLAQNGVPAGPLRQLGGTALTPAPGSYVTILSGGKVTPPTPAPTPVTPGGNPTISSVAFTGSATDPSFVVRGTNLGARPSPSPTGHPSGLNGCPVIAGDTGFDYGTSLYIAVSAKNWAGGRSRTGETDCIDLVVTKFTPTEVDFHFGPFYASTYPKFALTTGTQVQVVVNGATLSTTVKYG